MTKATVTKYWILEEDNGNWEIHSGPHRRYEAATVARRLSANTMGIKFMVGFTTEEMNVALTSVDLKN